MPRVDKRLQLMGRIVAGGFVIAALSQAKVQVLQHSSIIAKATETDRFMITRFDPAKRGTINSADGKALAEDEDTRLLNMDFAKVPHTSAFFMDVSAATGIPASEFLQLAHSGSKSRTWRTPISSAQAEQLQKVKSTWRADGISLAPSGRRSYPLAEAAASFIGVKRDGKPQGGLESGRNQLLAGRNGKKVGLVDRAGEYLPGRLDATTVQKVDGLDLTLTVDSQLQTAAANAIREAVETNNATQGVAIILNPHTGDLVAMANWPSYDPNTLGDAEGQQVQYGFNPNYMAVLEPGSMFKILTLAKAFDQGVVNETDGVYCHGELEIGKRSVKCDSHHGNRAHGLVSPAMAIAKSCNISAATWALRIGYPNFVDYLHKLHILEKPHLGVPGERAALFNKDDPAQDLHLANLGFGQAINVTPVQLASALSIIANNGVRMQPRLVKRIGGKEIPPVSTGPVVRPESAQRVLKIMQLVIESDAGTGKDLRIPGYILGGKTGTAQKANLVTHSMEGGGYVANFVGFVPGDKPQYMILVMVDNPKAGKYYGASVAGPVFKELALDVINRFNIPPNGPATLKAPINLDAMQGMVKDIITIPALTRPPKPVAKHGRHSDGENPIADINQPVDQVLGLNANEPAPNAIEKVESPLDDAARQIMPNALAGPPSDDEPAKPEVRHRRRRRHEGEPTQP